MIRTPAVVLAALLLGAACTPGSSSAPSAVVSTPAPSASASVAPSSLGPDASVAPSASASGPVELTIQEFEVPSGSHPHDVAPAVDGGVWYTGQRVGTLGYLDPSTGSIETLTRTVEGSMDRDYEWMPDGQTALMTAGTKVFAWSRAEPSWREVLDVAPHGLGAATRLAVSPDADALAVVTAEK